jgi:hypothetical protein
MKKTVIILSLLFLGITASYARLQLDLETGAAISGYNDVRIPNNSEYTKLSFTDDLKSDTVPFFRANLHYRLHERHRLSLLYAPLTIKPTGTVNRDVVYQDEIFPAGEEIEAIYRFDSYRLQYRYYFRNQNRIFKAIGLTVKLRHAEIKIESEQRSATKKDTGFVPIINFLLSHNLSPDFELVLDGEALFSPYGRAADVLFSLNYLLNDRFTLYGGYRILEGGSDNDEVYTFALINYMSLGLKTKF